MRAVWLMQPGKLEMRETEEVSPGRGEVKVRVKAVGICGSDVNYYNGINSWALHTIGDNPPLPPSILGHEVAGEVVEVGEASKRKVGDRVGIMAMLPCNECEQCRRGRYNLCSRVLHMGHDGNWAGTGVPHNPGGYADYVTVKDFQAVPLPPSVSYEDATQLDGTAVAVHALRRAGIFPGDSVAVIGAGPIGLLALQVAKAYGAGAVMAVDVEEAPLSVAKELGADEVVNATREDPVEAAKAFSPGEKYDEGVDLVLNTVGGETAVEGLKMLRRGGKELLFAGLLHTLKDFDMMLLGGEREITSTANNQPEDYPIGVKLMAEGKVKAKPFITHEFPLDEYAKAFEVALNKGKYGAIKVLMKP